MDDNKTLTLASNERIPLTPPMRLLLEIENMREASPATVSRGKRNCICLVHTVFLTVRPVSKPLILNIACVRRWRHFHEFDRCRLATIY
jgi:hypothetical protein